MKRTVKVLLAGAVAMIALAGCGNGKSAFEDKTAVPAAEETAVEEIPAEEGIPDSEEKALELNDDLITVGIVSIDLKDSACRIANDDDLRAVFTEENGYYASFAYGMENDEQITKAQEFIRDGVDYLLLSAVDAAGWESVLMDAQDAGVRVILFDHTIHVDEDLYETSIVSDLKKEAETAVGWLESQNLESCNIIHLQGMMGSAAQEGRTAALNEKVKEHSNWTLVTQQTAEWSADDAKQIVRSVIDAGEPFNVIYAENDDMAKGAVAALDEAEISHGVGGRVIVMSFDGNKWALEELLAQNWNYDECNFYWSYYLDEAIKMIETGGEVEKTIVIKEKSFDATTITAEEIEDYGL